MSQIRAIRGMTDILPEDSWLWQHLEQQAQRVLSGYGYQEIRLPVVERTELFSRGIGEVTDIVEKEMYSFADRNDESLSLRPEGTAGCVRAVSQHGLLNTPQKLWYIGPMFRYERPQKGRQRQFHQIGVEAFGVASADIDAELILASARLWRSLGIEAAVELQINSIGDADSRNRYRNALVEYLSDYEQELDEDSQRRLLTNPLRILDSKNPQTQSLLNDAPVLTDYLDAESAEHFEQLQDLLGAAGLSFTVNPRLVRGLDYYNRTVFEWVTDSLGAQGTVCAGGRYDTLVEQLGGRATPAAGFAMGLERLILMLQSAAGAPRRPAQAQVYVVAVGEGAHRSSLALAEQVRDALPALALMVHNGGGSFKSQMKKADKSGAVVALIIGEQEVLDGTVALKTLRSEGGEQIQVSATELVEHLQQHFKQQSLQEV